MIDTKLVSIVCPGHSGSTLLDMVIGTLPGAASTGELIYIPWKIYKENHPEKYLTTYCSCGEKMSTCLFWRPVLDSLSDKLCMDIFEQPENFKISLLHPFYYGKNRKHKLLINILTEISKFISINHAIAILYPFYAHQVKNNWKLFSTIKKIHNKKIVVDSSKDIYRYLLLRRYRKNNTKLIVLVRDVFGVASSIHNIPGLTEEIIFSRANAWKRFYNSRLYNVLKHLEKSEYMIVKYKDLATNPSRIRQLLAEFLEIECDTENIEGIIPSQLHAVAGNPIRTSEGLVKIKYDERWRKRLSNGQIAKLSVINQSLKDIYKHS